MHTALLVVASVVLTAPSPQITPLRLEAFAPLPPRVESKKNPISDAKVRLGRALYFEERLSKSGTMSCNTCHTLNTFGVDNKALSPGHDGTPGRRNSPSVYNSAGHFVQFWDGRADDVETQAAGPLTNPIEMGMSEADVVAVLKKDAAYVAMFRAAFPKAKQPVTMANVGKALGAYERLLITPSRWDAFLSGKSDAITDDEKMGFNVFADSGCIICHDGPYLGGNLYRKAGLVTPWPNQTDQGRFEITQTPSDRMQFKVPSLRNVAMTAPYFHDGSMASLEDAVKLMGKYQLAKELTPEEVRLVTAWLGSLTGIPPPELITPP